jgi:hypothetical protein
MRGKRGIAAEEGNSEAEEKEIFAEGPRERSLCIFMIINNLQNQSGRNSRGGRGEKKGDENFLHFSLDF